MRSLPLTSSPTSRGTVIEAEPARGAVRKRVPEREAGAVGALEAGRGVAGLTALSNPLPTASDLQKVASPPATRPSPFRKVSPPASSANVVSLPGLHPGQVVVEEALDRCRFVMLMCGRRWGKTKYGVRRAAVVALNGGQVGWFAPTYKLAGEAFRELVKRLKPAAVRIREDDKRIELRGGGVVEVWTLDSDDPARGRAYDLVVLDEAGIVKGLKGIWDAAIRPVLTDRKGKALFLGTPKGMSGEFVRMFAKAQRDGVIWFALRAKTVDNPWIDPSEVEQARSELPPAIFSQEYEGVPADDGGNPFGLQAIVDCTGPLSNKKPVVYGLDLARASDYCFLIGLDEDAAVCRLERWQAPWMQTRMQVVEWVGDVPVVADSTGVGDAIVEDLQTLGVLATAFKFTQPSKTMLMQRLITAIQTRFLTFPEGHLTAELEMFGYTFTPSGVRYEAPPGLHDDGVMALGLALYGWDRVQAAKPLRLQGPHLPPPQDSRTFAAREEETSGYSSQFPVDY
jgi:hypothetical protein